MLLFQITGAFAEFERTMIKTRVRAGMQTVKNTLARDGKFVSRKTGIVRTHLGRPGAEKEKLAAARAPLTKGTGIVKTAKLIGLGVGTIHRLKRAIGGHAATDLESRAIGGSGRGQPGKRARALPLAPNQGAIKPQESQHGTDDDADDCKPCNLFLNTGHRQRLYIQPALMRRGRKGRNHVSLRSPALLASRTQIAIAISTKPSPTMATKSATLRNERIEPTPRNWLIITLGGCPVKNVRQIGPKFRPSAYVPRVA